jgi:hypothetical protein
MRLRTCTGSRYKFSQLLRNMRDLKVSFWGDLIEELEVGSGVELSVKSTTFIALSKRSYRLLFRPAGLLCAINMVPNF